MSNKGQRRLYWRMTLAGLVAGLGLLLTGDNRTQAAAEFGIDPLEVLDVQIKNNVFIIFDTSGSMAWPADINNRGVGGDDVNSRLYQAKVAVDAVVRANRNTMNFGMATYNVPSNTKSLSTNSGPLNYVSVDPDAANFWGNFACPAGGTDVYWCDMAGFFGSADGTNSSDVFRSFQNDNLDFDPAIAGRQPYPVGCTVGGAGLDGAGEVLPGNCFYYLTSRRLRSGVRFTWDVSPTQGNAGNKLLATTSVTCPLPPAGLTSFNPDNDGDGRGDEARPCIVMQAGTGGPEAVFFLASGLITNGGSGSNCGGAGVITAVAPCTGDNSQVVLDAVAPEITVGNFTGTDFGIGVPNTNPSDIRGLFPAVPIPASGQIGVRAGQFTPLAGSLNDVRTAGTPFFPVDPTGGLQKNFVILLTDGDDTCASETGSGPDGNYRTATTVAIAAENLYQNSADPQRQAETFVIAFTNAVNLANANRIAQGGSGGNVSATNGTVTCPPGVPCRNAILATNTDELIDALTSALEIAVSAGTFAASPGVIGGVFEISIYDPLDPDTRYDDRANVLFQSSFSLPNWEGTVQGFRNDGTAGIVPVSVNTSGQWDAGQTLYDNVSQVMAATTGAGGVVNEFTFAELHGGATVDDIGTSAALIKRRIFTSAGGGRFPRTTDAEFDSAAASGRNVVALWPPNQAALNSGLADVDPVVGTPGPLDDALGIGAGSSPVLTFAQLQSFYGACQASADTGYGAAPAACATPDIDTARKEARQILLAWIAGAQIALSPNDGLPRRDPAGELLYEDRGWLMTDSTYSKPAVMSPPLRTTPSVHAREWALYRDGRRDADRQGIDELDLGFGLRNPDFEDANPTADLDLKPRMTVLFVGTNFALHALSGATSEELWAFVPFDLLDIVGPLMRGGQTRDNHLYGIATSIRIADIFVPVPFSVSGFTFDGRWRTFLYFGRGAGGKHITGLDVTAPGPFTRGCPAWPSCPTYAALATNPPWVAFSRGNPDVDLNGNAVNTADTVPYSFMGQTWSVPAVGSLQFIDASPADGVTDNPPEFRLWMGSGYSDQPDEGTTFYTLDAVTGDVVQYVDVGDPDPTLIADNALVANPAAWNAEQLRPPFDVLTDRADYVTRVFIPDLHGRVWKFDETGSGEFFNATYEHPIADGPALIDASSGDFVFVGSGHDVRAPEPGTGFKIWGLEDVGGDGDTSTAAALAFDDFYPAGFRNRSEPATVFNANDQGRVFFLGQRFNAPGVTCLSSFDAFIFALSAATGTYVYDFTGDGTGDAGFQMTGTAPLDISTSGNRLNVLEGGSDFTPTPVTTPSPSPVPDAQVVTVAISSGSPVCRQ